MTGPGRADGAAMSATPPTVVRDPSYTGDDLIASLTAAAP
jgi:hypothetical protein